MKYTVEVKRMWIAMAVVYAKANLKKMAWSHKPLEIIERFLQEHPGDAYRLTAESTGSKFCLTAECTEEKRPAGDVDRESEEEQADPSENHYR